MADRGKKRIGIFSGTLDPIHRGHVEACLVAIDALSLDEVLILVEKQPHRKSDTTDYQDRKNMIELATMEYPSLHTVDINDHNVTTRNTLDYLKQNYPEYEYWYIFGSDIIEHIESWPSVTELFKTMNICVVLRENDQRKIVEEKINKWQERYPTTHFYVLPSVWSSISSSKVKESLRKGHFINGIDPAVEAYIKRHNLY